MGNYLGLFFLPFETISVISTKKAETSEGDFCNLQYLKYNLDIPKVVTPNRSNGVGIDHAMIMLDSNWYSQLLR